MNIDKVIIGYTLVDFLSNTCPFKVIEIGQCSNMFRDKFEWTRIQHI